MLAFLATLAGAFFSVVILPYILLRRLTGNQFKGRKLSSSEAWVEVMAELKARIILAQIRRERKHSR